MDEESIKNQQHFEKLQRDIEPGRRKKLWAQLDQLDSAFNELENSGGLTKLEKKTRLHC